MVWYCKIEDKCLCIVYVIMRARITQKTCYYFMELTSEQIHECIDTKKMFPICFVVDAVAYIGLLDAIISLITKSNTSP